MPDSHPSFRSQAFQTADQFAAALDKEDYEQARLWLAPDCLYASPTGSLIGPDKILDSYQSHGDAARGRFDSIDYRHRAQELEDGWIRIEFMDAVSANQRQHVFRCHQLVRVVGELIEEIVHQEIAGERERLNQFLETLNQRTD